MKSIDMPLFLGIEKQCNRLVRLAGLPPIIFAPMSVTNCRTAWGLVFLDANRIEFSVRRRFKTRWGGLHLAYQITDTICHEIAHVKLNNPFHDSRFLRWHAYYLTVAARSGVHSAIEQLVSKAP